VSGEAFLSISNAVIPLGSWGSAPEPAGELTTLPRPLTGLQGAYF